MKKFFSALLVALVGCFTFAPTASAYNQDLADLAKEMNAITEPNGMITTYDGTNLVLIMPDALTELNLDAEEKAMLGVLCKTGIFAEKAVSSFMGDTPEFGAAMYLLLSVYETNLVMRMGMGGNEYCDVTITPEVFSKVLDL